MPADSLSPAEAQTLCELCGVPTRMDATKRCDRCWELERRIKCDPDLAMLVMLWEGLDVKNCLTAPEAARLFRELWRVRQQRNAALKACQVAIKGCVSCGGNGNYLGQTFDGVQPCPKCLDVRRFYAAAGATDAD